MKNRIFSLIVTAIIIAFPVVSSATERFPVGSTHEIRYEVSYVTCANGSDVFVNVGTEFTPIWERIRAGEKVTVLKDGRFTVVSKKDGEYLLRYSFGPKHGSRQFLELPAESLFKASEKELVDLLTNFAEKCREGEKALAAELVRISKETNQSMTLEELLAYKP